MTDEPDSGKIYPGEQSDCCGVQGTILLVNQHGTTDLLLCAHHYRKNEPKLLAEGFRMIDSLDDWSSLDSAV